MKDMKLSQKIYIENSLKSKNLITILLSALNSGRQNHLPWSPKIEQTTDISSL